MIIYDFFQLLELLVANIFFKGVNQSTFPGLIK
jgi:hypothetical protein